jgi:hypothetical protein
VPPERGGAVRQHALYPPMQQIFPIGGAAREHGFLPPRLRLFSQEIVKLSLQVRKKYLMLRLSAAGFRSPLLDREAA